jgi:hypothetical protein
MAMAATHSVAPETQETGTGGSKIGVGDWVVWNGRYKGLVREVNGATAVILERHNELFGRAIKWRLNLCSLTRIE